jgi:hypothetical protein
MPFFFPGSSEQVFSTPPSSSAIVDKLEDMLPDEPLPELPPRDRIRLQAQSPRSLFVYWNFRNDPFETLRRAFGSVADWYSLAVKLINIDNNEEFVYGASPTRSQWLDVAPDHSYRVDVGLYAQGRGFIRLLSSNVVRAPRAGVSRHTDVSFDWHVTPERFARILDQSGYVSDALEVTLEAADEATRSQATRAVAKELGGITVPELNEDELVELRGLLAALAMGISLDDLLGMLSPALAQWLETIRQQHEETLQAARLFEIFRFMLGLEADQFDIVSEEASHRAARFHLGASEVNMPARPFHLWMPSMSKGALESKLQQ